MRPKFQADADLNYKIVLGVRRREPAAEFIDAHQGGMIRISDADVLARAANAQRIVVSHDRKTMPSHFARFLKFRDSPGLIVVAQHLDVGLAIEELLLIWAVSTAEEWQNKLGFVPL